MSDSITSDPRMTNALDFAGLAQMRAGAVEGDEKVTKEVAQQFEAIFINMMLKSMREATDRSGLLDSETTKTYESMFDQQLSTSFSNGTFGIAQALQSQLNLSPKPAAKRAARCLCLLLRATNYAKTTGPMNCSVREGPCRCREVSDDRSCFHR